MSMRHYQHDGRCLKCGSLLLLTNLSRRHFCEFCGVYQRRWKDKDKVVCQKDFPQSGPNRQPDNR